MKKTEAEQIKEIKQAATIKVKTLAIAIIWSITVIAAIVGGWTLKCISDAKFEYTVTQAVENRTQNYTDMVDKLITELKTQK